MMNKISFLQLNNGFAGQHYLPLAVGMLASIVKAQSKYSNSIELGVPEVFFSDNMEIAERLRDSTILAASLYVWNEVNTLDICRRVKQLNPGCLIVVGGPQVPNSMKQFRRRKSKELTEQEKASDRIHFTEDFHLKHPFIDFCIHGEGELAFLDLVDTFLEHGKEKCLGLPSVSGIGEEGNCIFSYIRPRMRNEELQDLPSPILDGFFDRVLRAYPEQRWNLMYETDRGCPYQCSYCDWGGATEDKVTRFSPERIQKEIEWIGSRKIDYIFLANANFGILDRDSTIASLFVEAKNKYGYPKAVSTQNAKNPKDHTLRALKILESGGLNKATVMSQQSLNPLTLKLVRRDNMQLDEYYKIQSQMGADGIYTMTDLIFPMPGEDIESIRFGIDTLIDKGQLNRIQFNNLSVLVNTEMGNPEYQKKFSMELVSVPIINPHGRRGLAKNSLAERQYLVVATKTMPRSDWVEVRSQCWMLNFLFFNKLAQIPMLLLSEFLSQSVMTVMTKILDNSPPCGIISNIYDRFRGYATTLQAGKGNEFIHSESYLDIYWPPDELEYIDLVARDNLWKFYSELKTVINGQIFSDALKNDEGQILKESLDLNYFLLKKPENLESCLEISCSYDILSWYKNCLRGERDITSLGDTGSFLYSKAPQDYKDFSDWCEKVVWFGNRQGAYISLDVALQN